MTGRSGARIALIGFTGTGKSTIAEALLRTWRADGQSAYLIKLAAPLYRLQQIYYTEAGVHLDPGLQDQELMTEIATRLRKIAPRVLLDHFLTTLGQVPSGALVVNDDLREPEPDAAGLLHAGFCIIRLECAQHVRLARLENREDRSVVDEPALWGRALDTIPAALTVDTTDTSAAEAARRILDHLYANREYSEIG